jgi:two-component system sensor histidine kinase and response regulator WspE
MSDPSLLDLFREEMRSQTATLSQGLLALEADPSPAVIEPLMRAAHSIKGAARIMNAERAVGLAHTMEDAFVAAGAGRAHLGGAEVDALLGATDLLASLGQVGEGDLAAWGHEQRDELARLEDAFRSIATGAVVGQAASLSSAPLAAPSAGGASGQAGSLTYEEAGQAASLSYEEEPAPAPELFDLFREELRANGQTLLEGIAVLRQAPPGPQTLTDLARAAHSIKGAARLAGVGAGANLAGLVGDVLARAAEGPSRLGPAGLDALKHGTVALGELLEASPDGVADWGRRHEPALADLRAQLDALAVPAPDLIPAEQPPARLPIGPARQVVQVVHVGQALLPDSSDRQAAKPDLRAPDEAVVRVTAQSLNRLMGLAGESLVQARWLQPFSTALLHLKKQQDHLAGLLDHLGQALAQGRREHAEALLDEARGQAGQCRQTLGERMREFEDHSAHAEDLNSRLYHEVIVSRMRPFADGAHAFPRLVRDMARKLDRQVRLEIDGQATEVDRDILEKLEAPLTHLLRNAVDHGMEPPDERQAAGKPAQGLIRLEVRHRAGMLALTICDDGRGVDLERLRQRVVERGLATAEMAGTMTPAELLEFLFLPGFSTAGEVTEYSGRGVGLDVVRDMVRRVGGSVRLSSRPGQGTTVHLSLPITLSVLRAVLVDVGGEPYAFPHNRIDRLLRVRRGDVRSLEHRQFVRVDDHNVGLVLAAQLFDLPANGPPGDELPVVLLSDDTGQYGLIVEAFRGEQDLVVRPLDPRLGKVPNVSAAAILDDGSPVLIADVEDLVRGMDQFIQTGSLVRCDETERRPVRTRRVLVVDDSITVREVERQLLRNEGYEVAVAIDGMDGWNQVRASSFDLVVTDVDMPRMTGLELIRAIRDHERLRDLPVIIVSYKDREEDRLRGLDLGASCYLTKSSFHDNTFLKAVADLIGEA